MEECLWRVIQCALVFFVSIFYFDLKTGNIVKRALICCAGIFLALWILFLGRAAEEWTGETLDPVNGLPFLYSDPELNKTPEEPLLFKVDIRVFLFFSALLCLEVGTSIRKKSYPIPFFGFSFLATLFKMIDPGNDALTMWGNMKYSLMFLLVALFFHVYRNVSTISRLIPVLLLFSSLLNDLVTRVLVAAEYLKYDDAVGNIIAIWINMYVGIIAYDFLHPYLKKKKDEDVSKQE